MILVFVDVEYKHLVLELIPRVVTVLSGLLRKARRR
jgi:hypothetical protein